MRSVPSVRVAPRRSRRWIVALAVGIVAVVVSTRLARVASASDVRCPASPRALLFVDTALHALAVCEHGAVLASFPVRLGRGGVGKTREGDDRTPLGSYALATPRPSVAYGTFLAVGYPTAEQRRAGFTGGAVGVHGPHRRVRWAGSLTTLFDTTEGCVGLATDDDMARLGALVRDHGVDTIVLR